MLSAPLRDRFGVVNRLEFYTPKELCEIVLHSAKRLDVSIEKEGAMELARRSRGTPRLANRFLKRVRDFAQIKYDGIITKEVADFALDLLEVDKLGLDRTDRTIILTMINQFGGGPVGLKPWQLQLVKMLGRWRMSMSRILYRMGFWCARRGAGWRLMRRICILGLAGPGRIC